MGSVSLNPIARLLRKPWYAVWRAIEHAMYRGREYSLSVPFGQRIYTPWFSMHAEPEFSQAILDVQGSGRLGVSLDRCYVLHHLATDSARRLPGRPMAECGVYTGGTAQLIASAIRNAQGSTADLHLFDTFEGMPDTSEPARDYHEPGDFSDTSLVSVQQRLDGFTFCVFHPGFIPHTFSEVEHIEGFSFVHIDVDIYPSVRDCLEWFWPRLSPGGTIVFDDYGFFPYRDSARLAVDEFFVDLPERPWVLPTGQAVVTKW